MDNFLEFKVVSSMHQEVRARSKRRSRDIREM